MITEDYVSFETAKLLKERGFEGDTSCYYTQDNAKRWVYQHYHDFDKKDRIECPTLQMAMKWLREVHNIGIFPTTFYRHTATFDGHNYGCTLVNLKTFDVIGDFEDCTFPADSYEEACEAAIKYCLKNLM